MTGLAFGQTSGQNPFISFLPLLLIIAVLYFLMILPQQRRQKRHQEMISKLKKGDRVVTSSGILGIITNVKERTFLLRVSEGVDIEIEKSAIGFRLGGE